MPIMHARFFSICCEIACECAHPRPRFSRARRGNPTALPSLRLRVRSRYCADYEPRLYLRVRTPVPLRPSLHPAALPSACDIIAHRQRAARSRTDARACAAVCPLRANVAIQCMRALCPTHAQHRGNTDTFRVHKHVATCQPLTARALIHGQALFKGNNAAKGNNVVKRAPLPALSPRRTTRPRAPLCVEHAASVARHARCLRPRCRRAGC
eukprot:IDg16634t1